MYVKVVSNEIEMQDRHQLDNRRWLVECEQLSWHKVIAGSDLGLEDGLMALGQYELFGDLPSIDDYKSSDGSDVTMSVTVLQLEWMGSGKWIVTQHPVYILNDQGKTVERIR